MPTFDVLLLGGTVVDGTGARPRRADVGLHGDQIRVVGDLSAADLTNTELVLDVAGMIVAPGFIDALGHSDASVFVDGALASHLRQGFTTQLSGNCGITLAPLTEASRQLVDPELGHGVVARWKTFAEYLNAVDETELGPNIAFLVGHGTLRAAVMGMDSRGADDAELMAMERELESALEAGAFGMSSGLAYRPSMHAQRAELERLVAIATSRDRIYATHLRNEAGGLFGALEEAIATAKGQRGRLEISHLRADSRSVWGRAKEAVARLERERADGLDLGADQSPYTAASRGLSVVLPAALHRLSTDETIRVLADVETRQSIRTEIEAGRSEWANLAFDPGWQRVLVSFSESHPDWTGQSLGALASELGVDPIEFSLNLLADDRLETRIAVESSHEDDVRTLLTVPWIAVCSDAEARRAGHPVLDTDKPHPRTYGTTGRLLGQYVRDEGVLPLELAVAKLTSVPASRLRLRDRGVVREGARADIVVFDPTTIAENATWEQPAQYAKGIEHVFVNGTPVLRRGEETGERPGLLLRAGAD